MIDSNWILFRNPRQERKRAEPGATGSRLSPKRQTLKTVIKDRWPRRRWAYQHACMYARSLILDRAAKQMECQAAGKRSTPVSADEPLQTIQSLISGASNTMIAALNNTSTDVCYSPKEAQFVDNLGGLTLPVTSVIFPQLPL